MKGTGLTAVAALLALVLSVPASAAPKLQTYAVGAAYHNNYLDSSLSSWLNHSSNFDRNVVGTWGSTWSNRTLRPTDHWFALGTVRGESGAIAVNGVLLSALNTQAAGNTTSLFSSPMGEIDARYHIGAFTEGPDILGVSYGGEIVYDDEVLGIPWDPHEGRHHERPNRRGGGGGGGNHATPEPGTLTLLGTGLIGLIPILRRKYKRK